MDLYENQASSLESPALFASEITPDDSSDLAYVTRAIWVGGKGDLAVIMQSGASATFKNVQGWMPLRAKRIKAASTSATDIVGVW
ncbi:MAG: hypothetical protein N4A65_01510 [Cohaesibacter sp.]|jgi:hypothetical protein|nr:hypothetical protein [Cohaesibacter sp.]